MTDQLLADARFDALLAAPDIAEMLKLSPSEFEQFVAAVFQSAGYFVEDVTRRFGQGLDLKLYTGGRAATHPAMCVSIKRYADKVGLQEVFQLRGALKGPNKAQGAIVTTSDFAPPAYQDMAKNPPILPINGKHLARYITYVRGSRLAGLNSAIIPPDCLFDADRIVKRSPTQTKVVTIANNKGGVGKTTTALHLALQLAEMEQRVLLIDLEEQTNLSDSLPNPFDGRQTPHIVDYFTKRGPLPALVRPTPFDRVWIVPGHRQVHLVDTNTPLFYPVELQFMHDVHDSSLIPPVYQNSAFDWIILDTSPNMSLRTRAALAAAHYVLAPTKTSEYDLQGLERLLETISTMNGLRGDNAVLLGAVVTQWDEKQANRAALLNLEGDLAKLKVRLFDARIPFDSGLSRTPGTAYKPSRNPSAGIAQYRELAKEVIRYVSGS